MVSFCSDGHIYIRQDKTTANSVVVNVASVCSVFHWPGHQIIASVATWTGPRLIMKIEKWPPTSMLFRKALTINCKSTLPSLTGSLAIAIGFYHLSESIESI